MSKAYKCPVCKNQLTSMTKYNKDFFCKNCHTAVVIVDYENRIDCYMLPRGETFNRPCIIEEIRL